VNLKTSNLSSSVWSKDFTITSYKQCELSENLPNLHMESLEMYLKFEAIYAPVFGNSY
jgi:hypothetical protein